MKRFCENQYCENPGFKVVPVSAERASDGTRTLCAPCEEAYSWGVQHGFMIAGGEAGAPIPNTLKHTGRKRSRQRS